MIIFIGVSFQEELQKRVKKRKFSILQQQTPKKCFAILRFTWGNIYYYNNIHTCGFYSLIHHDNSSMIRRLSDRRNGGYQCYEKQPLLASIELYNLDAWEFCNNLYNDCLTSMFLKSIFQHYFYLSDHFFSCCCWIQCFYQMCIHYSLLWHVCQLIYFSATPVSRFFRCRTLSKD